MTNTLDKAVEQRLDKKYGVSKDHELITTTRYSFKQHLASEITRAKQETLNTVDREVIGEDEGSGYSQWTLEQIERNKLKATQRVALAKLREGKE